MTNAEKLRKIREILAVRRELLETSNQINNSIPGSHYNTPKANFFMELESLILAALDEERP